MLPPSEVFVFGDPADEAVDLAVDGEFFDLGLLVKGGFLISVVPGQVQITRNFQFGTCN